MFMTIIDASRAEEQIVLQSIRVADTASVEAIEAVLRKEIDWTWLIRHALTNKISQQLYHTLNRVDASLIPASIREALHHHYLKNCSRSRYLVQELKTLARLANARGVPVLSFKGPILALSAYGDVGQRISGDLDVLIKRKDLTAFCELLNERGYINPFALTHNRNPSAPESKHYEQYQCQYLYVRQRDQLMVEPHWDITPRTLAIDVDISGVWARSIKVPIGDILIGTLHPEDNLTVLCIHGSKHHWHELRWILDIGQFLAKHPGLDYVTVLERAEERGTQRMVLLGLELAHRCTGVQLPRLAMKYLDSDRATARLADGVVAGLFRSDKKTPGMFEIDWFRLRMRERIRQRVHYVLRTAFTPRVEHVQMNPFPERLSWLNSPIKIGHDYFALPMWLMLKRVWPDAGRRWSSQPDAELAKARMRANWRARASLWEKWSWQAPDQHNESDRVLLEMADVRPGQRVVDIAAGPGEATIAIARRVGSRGQVVSTDHVPSMVRTAKKRVASLNLDNVSCCVADMTSLPFLEASFDRAICRLGLMFAPDAVETLKEIRRVLRVGGRVGIAVWGESDENPVYTRLHSIYCKFFDIPLDLRESPLFRYGSPGTLRSLMISAAFKDVEERAVHLHRLVSKETEFWRPILEQSFNLDFELLPGEIRSALQEKVESAFYSSLEDDKYQLTSCLQIAAGTR